MNYLEQYAAVNDLTVQGRRKYWRGYELHFAPLLPASRQARILDIGCGAGLLLEWLTQGMGYTDVTGVDIDQSQVQFARNIGQHAELISDLIRWLPQQGSFDACFINDVLEHLPPPSVGEYLRAVNHNLRPNGTLILRVPNALSPIAMWALYHDPTHLRLYTVESLTTALHDAGFQRIDITHTDSRVPGSLRETALLLVRAISRAAKRIQYRIELGRSISGHPLSPNLLAAARKNSTGTTDPAPG